MIHYIVARNDDEIFKNWLLPSLNQFKNSSLIEIFNEENDSIFKKYNRGLDRISIKEDDIVCFIHEDIKILDGYFEQKVEMVFNKLTDTGVLGVIGSKYISPEIGWWLCDHKHHIGQIEQGFPDGRHFRMIKKV
jgi:hypothetical protein